MLRPGRLLLLVAVALAAVAPPARAGGWLRPVPGPVARGFDLGSDPFERGRHRGADLGAAAGAPVRAACTGRVMAAGPVGSNGRLVSMRCGAWRVSYGPLAAVDVRAGAVAARGERLGTVGTAVRHAGLHLGVRREGRRFGYVDPLRFLGTQPPGVPPLGGRARGRRGLEALVRRAASLGAAPAPAVQPLDAPAPGDSPSEAPAPGASPVAAGGPGAATRGLAPWPAWVGLALLLAGAAGSAGGGRRRRTRAPAAARSHAAPEPVR